jgi:hypothetical protein
MYMSAALLGNETATKSTPMRAASDVFHVLGGQRRRREAAALAVDALVVGQFAAVADDGEDLRTSDALDVEDDAPVVEQQDAAGRDVTGEILVVEADALVVAQFALGVENEALALSSQALAFGEFSNADLRPLQVGENADRPADAGSHLTHQLARATCSSALPWEKLRRTTSTPARIIRSRTSASRRPGRGWQRSWYGESWFVLEWYDHSIRHCRFGKLKHANDEWPAAIQSRCSVFQLVPGALGAG